MFKRWDVFDDDGMEVLITEYVQDVQPILDFNKVLRNDVEHTPNWLRRKLSIPQALAVQLEKDMGINIYTADPDELEYFCEKMISDPDYKWLRTYDKN